MKRILLLFLLTFLIPINKVEAYQCKFSDLSIFKGLASNITATYEYVENEKGISFSITLVNLNENLYIVDTINDKTHHYKENELTIAGYAPGTTVKYQVYADDEHCSGELLYTIRVVLPDYNPYYSSSVCEGVENYIYCQKWYKHNLSYEEFLIRVEAYKKSLIHKPDVEPVVPGEYELLEAILDILIEYYYVILLAIIAVCGSIIYVNEKKSNIYK